MNFPEAYKKIFGVEDDKKPGEGNPPPPSREVWLNHPNTIELQQTLLTLSMGFTSYAIGVSSVFEDHKERIKESLHKVNVLTALHGYITTGDFNQLAKSLNFVEKE